MQYLLPSLDLGDGMCVRVAGLPRQHSVLLSVFTFSESMKNNWYERFEFAGFFKLMELICYAMSLQCRYTHFSRLEFETRAVLRRLSS